MKYLVTGIAGFIGFHLTKRLLEKGETVVGIDNLNDYYDVRLKYIRLKELGIEHTDFDYNNTFQSNKFPTFQFIKIDIADNTTLKELFKHYNFDIVCNLAAQAGVIYSTINPDAYIHSNILGFINILECCKETDTKLIYASSSSVYGDNSNLPFSETDTITMPKNLYAKTKINNEYLAQMYSDHFELQTIGLRFFSVYGTFGRPDMVMWIFTNAMLNHLPITIYGDGSMKRDYTYVADVIMAIEKITDYFIDNKSHNEIFNIGNSNPVSLLELVEKLENQLGIKSIKTFLPIRPEETLITWADVSKIKNITGYSPQTTIEKGILEFICWYKTFSYYDY